MGRCQVLLFCEPREEGIKGREKERNSETADEAEWRKPDTRILDSSLSVASHTQATGQPCQPHPEVNPESSLCAHCIARPNH